MQTNTTDQLQVEHIEYVSDQPFDDVVKPRTECTRIGYDRPSSLMHRPANPELGATARKLDAKLAALVERVTGA